MQAVILSSVLAAALISGGALSHPDHDEPGLLFHFAVGGHPIQNGAWQDLSHQCTAQVIGSPQVRPSGPTEALIFAGEEMLLLAGTRAEADKLLPKREMTVAAWVRLDDSTNRGGIVGFTQDNRTAQQGWSLGYQGQRFTFSLAGSEGADAGKLTQIRSETAIASDRWYYVAATYDGHTMRLYVNGKLEAESTSQAGDIQYPAAAQYVACGYRDNDEKAPLQGALFELKLLAHVRTAEEISAVAVKNQNLIDWRSTPETDLVFLVSPYLQFATTNSIVVMCETSRPTTMTVEYAETRPLAQKAKTTAAQAISELTLRDLKPFTRYFYRVVCHDESGAELRGDLHSFQTAPPENMPWAFAVIGDTQRNPEVTRKCADDAYSRRPNFLLHCGDVVDDGFAKNQWLKDLFEPCANLMANIPTYPVIGNHEKDSHWYYDYFSLPDPEYHYTFRYGNAQFFMIDSNKPLRPGSPQHVWLESELAKSTATWKFTCHHHPCFSSDENDYGDHVQGRSKKFAWGDTNAQKLVPLYEKYGVDIAFNGHIHVYERTWPIFEMAINQEKGVRYVTSGGGGGHLEQAAPQRSWFSLHFQRAFHTCHAAVHDRTIVFKAYDIDGRLFDTFELTKPPGR